MISPAPRADRRITGVTRRGDALILKSEAGNIRIAPKTANIFRIQYTDHEVFLDEKKTSIIFSENFSEWTYSETQEKITVATDELVLVVQRKTGAFTYFDKNGKLFLSERAVESRELESFDAYKLVHDEAVAVEKVKTADGVKQVIRDAKRVFDKKLYRTRLHLIFQEDEAIYGFGQNDEGILNLRGKRAYIHHSNQKIAIPMMVSSKGYGILFNTFSPMIFNDTGKETYIHTEADREMDFYFIGGGSMDGVVKGYRLLSGKATMLPKWAFGYIQSQERYETQEEILSVAEGFRKRDFGLDCIVLDWCSWSDNLWGQKTVDENRFPSLQDMTQALHKEHIRFMISIWPNMDEHSDNYKEFRDNELLIPGTTLYNPYDEQGRKLYWKQAKEGLFNHGVDAWWCDSSEPMTPEWTHNVKPEPDKVYQEYFEEGCKQFKTEDMNSYSLLHAKTMYEGQRGETEKKRVVNLTRCGYTGQQRYGTILWSGDISASWETLRKQIPDGLNLCASGLPYWTTDIGGFFVKKGLPWYWNGDYEDGNQNNGYRELYVRWFQYGCFSPVFRSHGTDTRREPWMFGEKGELFYDALKKTNELRYQLMPYLYSVAYRVWKDDFTIMRMLAFDFPDDSKARECRDQFLFGDRLMVCPVLDPMYYDRQGTALTADKKRTVYLPECPGGWYDFYSGEHYDGKRELITDAGIDRIPVFVKAGTIIPMTEAAGSVDEQEQSRITFHVYPGMDASFELYEDSGDGYGYEKGEYTLTSIQWNDRTKELIVGETVGEYEGRNNLEWSMVLK